VAAGFRTRRDWVAFVFDGPDGSVSLAVRRPATSVPPKGLRPDEIMPGEGQVSVNAVRELAADLGRAFPLRREGRQRTKVRIIVSPGKAARGAAGDDEGEGADEPPGAGDVSDDIAKKDIEGVTALATAAAWAAGWQPAFGPAEHALTVRLARGIQSYSVDVSLTGGGTDARFRKRAVPADALYPNLAAVCLKLRLGDSLADFARVTGGEARVLAASAEEVVVAADGSLKSWNPVTGESQWQIPRPERGEFRYVTRRAANGESAVYRLGGGIQRVGERGSLTAVSSADSDSSWGFAVAPDGCAAVAVGPDLVVLRDGAEAGRSHHAVELTCGPAFAKDRILAGTAAGEIVCVSAADLHAVWRRDIGQKLTGPLTVTGDLALAATAGGTLVAVRTDDGSVAWKADIGDVLLVPPERLGDRLLVAAKSNRLVALRPDTGEQVAAWQAKTWLLDAVVVPAGAGGCVACADLAGDIVFLDGEGLRPTRTVELGADLTPGMALAEKFPTNWGGKGGLIYEEAPAVLVPDRQGFLYIVPVPRRQAGGEAR